MLGFEGELRMGAIAGEELMKWEKMEGMSNDLEEKILVLVRLRPLNEKELSRNEVSDWECINDTTILFRNSLQERSMFPTAYTFDRVFRVDCPTRKVYDEGAKDIALSVVSGINSSIFAYGQTSSGKTYTMNGITEYTVADVYDYIQQHEERAFVLKFSAMEIYNEAIRDLLSTDNMPLRVLDDPEKGTIVERLTEETLRDLSHLKSLLSICEAQRKIGETSLNETSSRSHQILRLTIESSAREFIGKDKSTTLAASVNFVDLAGSERASQAQSFGQRLKEGCHINRSLLTLSTVIRKLSKGKHGHVNYRDSKLTRILQPCLGGNARTAIICTLSPARDHVEQSRNTLLFASCAKEVSTNAQVNVVMSDKALVKHLQKEVARLENELRTPGPTGDYSALLRKKDQQIERLEKEVRELTKQRDLAESRVEELLHAVRNDQASGQWDEHSVLESSDVDESHDPDVGMKLSNNSIYDKNTPLPSSRSESVPSGDNCREVHCVEMNGSNATPKSVPLSNGKSVERKTSGLGSERNGHYENGFNMGAFEQQFQDVQNTINSLGGPFADEVAHLSTSESHSNNKVIRSRSCRANFMAGSGTGSYEMEDQESGESTPPPNGFENSFVGRPEGFQRKQWNLPSMNYDTNNSKLLRSDSQSSFGSAMTEDINGQKNKASGDEDIPSVDSFVAGLKKAKLQYEKQLFDDQGGKLGKNGKDVGLDLVGPASDWHLEFARKQRDILELWEMCNVSLIHRTYFFLLFKGDPMDSIYMEVEVRRLSFLKETFSKGDPAVEEGRTQTFASSKKALRRERQMLSRLMNRRFSEEERKRIYQKWGINIDSKQRRLQLVNCLWSNSEDPAHIEESASIIAKLIRFSEQGQAPKEMFGLSFTPPHMVRRSLGWKHSMTSLL